MRYKCITKCKNRHNQIIGYDLMGEDGQRTRVAPIQLKEAIRAGRVEVTNLKLTADDRLIDAKSQAVDIGSTKKAIESFDKNMTKLLESFGKEVFGGYVNFNDTSDRSKHRYSQDGRVLRAIWRQKAIAVEGGWELELDLIHDSSLGLTTCEIGLSDDTCADTVSEHEMGNTPISVAGVKEIGRVLKMSVSKAKALVSRMKRGSALEGERLGTDKYVAFRIDTQTIREGKVVDGYFVRGQSADDLNWPLLAEKDSLEAAKDYIRAVRVDPLRQQVYGPGGYGIEL